MILSAKHEENFLKFTDIPELESLSLIANKYDVILIDVWGVTHNGVEPFPNAIKAYEQLKSLGKTLIVLSNAPRLPDITRKRLCDMEIDDSLFDDVFTSGLECHMALRDRRDNFYKQLGNKLFHIGPERDRTVFEGLPYTPVDTVAGADFLLITGTDGWEKDASAYTERLTIAKQKNMPVICANADKLVTIGDQLVICAGAIAEAYAALFTREEQAHLPLRIHGKPNPSLYSAAHELANAKRNEKVPLSRLLMLGDSLRTDIKGANTYGIDSVFTLSGIHRDNTMEEIETLMASYDVRPTYIMSQGIR